MPTVLDEMVIRITGDPAPLAKGLQKAKADAVAASKDIERSTGGGGGRLFHGVGRLATRSLGPLGGVAQAGIGSLGLGGGPLELAAVAGLGLVLSQLKRVLDNLHEANKAGNQAFQTIVTGARTSAQAMSDARVNTLTEGFRDLTRAVNPEGLWDRVNNAMDSFVGKLSGTDRIGIVIERVTDRIAKAQEALRALEADPRIVRLRRGLAQERNVQASRDLAQTLEEQADRSNLAANAAQRYEQIQRLAREANISMAAATRLLAADLQRQEIAQGRIAGGELARNLREQNNLVGLSAERAQVQRLRIQGVAEAQLEAAEAEARRAEALRRLAQPLEQIQAIDARTLDARFQIEESVRRIEFRRQAALIPGAIGEQAGGGAGAPAIAANAGQAVVGRVDQTNAILRDIREAIRGNRPATGANLQG